MAIDNDLGYLSRLMQDAGGGASFDFGGLRSPFESMRIEDFDFGRDHYISRDPFGIGISFDDSGGGSIEDQAEAPVADERFFPTAADIAALNRAGLGAVEGFNPHNPTQSLGEMQNAQQFASFLERGVAPAIMAATGAAPFVALAKTGAGLLSGDMTMGQAAQNLIPSVVTAAFPGSQTAAAIGQGIAGLVGGQDMGQVLTNTALGAVARELGVPAGTLNAMLKGDMGTAASNTVMGMVTGALAQATGIPAGMITAGINATGLGDFARQTISGSVNDAFGTSSSTNLAGADSTTGSLFSGLGFGGDAGASGSGITGLLGATGGGANVMGGESASLSGVSPTNPITSGSLTSSSAINPANTSTTASASSGAEDDFGLLGALAMLGGGSGRQQTQQDKNEFQAGPSMDLQRLFGHAEKTPVSLSQWLAMLGQGPKA